MACSSAVEAPCQNLVTEHYSSQKKYWPKQGRHIMAQHDENTVVVYQAYNRDIANYAVEHQSFGGEHFSFDRMSWIKPNFLWMMYRCGWSTKKNQEKVLAVRITRDGFDKILQNALTAEVQKHLHIDKDAVKVRLQWDPDHTPSGGKCERRAIQLGLRGDILKQYASEWIVEIKDITSFVQKQAKVLENQGEENLITPTERIYKVSDPKVAHRIGLDQPA